MFDWNKKLISNKGMKVSKVVRNTPVYTTTVLYENGEYDYFFTNTGCANTSCKKSSAYRSGTYLMTIEEYYSKSIKDKSDKDLVDYFRDHDVIATMAANELIKRGYTLKDESGPIQMFKPVTSISKTETITVEKEL